MEEYLNESKSLMYTSKPKDKPYKKGKEQFYEFEETLILRKQQELFIFMELAMRKGPGLDLPIATIMNKEVLRGNDLKTIIS